MAAQFEKVVGEPVDYEMLYVGEWKQTCCWPTAMARAGCSWPAMPCTRCSRPAGWA